MRRNPYSGFFYIDLKCTVLAGLDFGRFGNAVNVGDENDRLPQLVDAIDVSRRTMRIVRQNIVFALAVKALILILGALGIANMWTAVFGDVGVMILVR